jgi:putative ABC transport system permease protein
MKSSPPRLAEHIVRTAVRNPAWRETVLGDLGEEFTAEIARRGPHRAAFWYWRQAIGLALTLIRRATSNYTVAACSHISSTLGDRPMRSLLQEVRIAIRTVARRPLVALVIVLTLALGLGANAAVFAMADALWFRPFPVHGVERIAMLSENSPEDPYPEEAASPANFLDWKRQSDVFDRMAALAWWDVNVSGTDEPERVQGFLVSADFFPMLGVTPAHGRAFVADDETLGRHRRVVLGDALWHRRFGGDPLVVGRTIRLNGESYDVVGIAPAGFEFPQGSQIWAPLAFTPKEAAERNSRYLTAIARLKPGRTFDDARAEMAVIGDRLTKQYPEANAGRQLRVRTMLEGFIDLAMPQILGLWQTAALLVLIIACTNVASLLLARGAERQRELAVRLAIGAGRWRIIRQLLIENLVLSFAAVPLAMGVAWLALRACRAAMPAQIARFIIGWDQMYVNPRLAGYTIAAAMVTALLFGLLPALQTSRPDLTSSLKEGGRSASAGRTRSRLRRGLVIAEIALALPLLVCSGLATMGMHRFLNGPQGYNPVGVLTLKMVLPDAAYPTPDSRRQFVERVLNEVANVPGAGLAGTINNLPASGGNSGRTIAIEGQPPVSSTAEPPSVAYRTVSLHYFDAFQTPVLSGRSFSAADSATSQPVAVVSKSLAAKYWPTAGAVGKRLRIGDSKEWTTVVGVVGDTIDDWFDRRNAPMLFVPFTQSPTAGVALIVRTAGDPASLSSAIREAIRRVEPTQAVFDVMTMREQLSQRTVGLQFISSVMAVFGALALVLAAVGVYGVMAFYVTQRRHEIGVRMALGATTRDVLRLTTGQTGRLSIIGVAIGLVLAIALAHVMESVLFGIVAVEPTLFMVTAAALMTTGFLAGLIPARRATLIEPSAALRTD